MGVHLVGQREEDLVEREIHLRLDLAVQVLLAVGAQRGGGGVVVCLERREEQRHERAVAHLEDVIDEDPRERHRQRELDALAELEVKLAHPEVRDVGERGEGRLQVEEVRVEGGRRVEGAHRRHLQ